MFFIQKIDFLELLREFPSDYERFCYLKDKISLNGDIEVFQMECELCGKKTHRFQGCPFIGTHINTFKVLKKHMRSYDFIEFKRRPIKRREKKSLCFFKDQCLGSSRTLKTFTEHLNERNSEEEGLEIKRRYPEFLENGSDHENTGIY